MSLLENLLTPGTIERLGWMLVHVLWQATAVAVLLAVLLRLLRKAGANVRYWTACATLVLMVAMPVVTMRLLRAPGPVAEAGPAPITVALPPEVPALPDMTAVEMAEVMPAPMPRPAPLPTVDLPAPAVPLRERIVSTLEPALPYVVLGWLVGVFGLSAWHLGGWTQLQRLKRRMVREIGTPLQRRLEELSARLGVYRAVGLLESALVEVPTVVGWLRPVILLPASALTGLRPEQLEAILAHELAHIRRYDYLVNIVQTVVEILGFYHPAVWWVSHRIRIERENCCDDLAVHVCGNSLQYARALACMEEIRHSAGDLALAATGGSLMARIARLLGRPSVDDRRFAWLPGLVALLLVIGVIIPAALVLGTPQTPSAVELPSGPGFGSPGPAAALPGTENAGIPADGQAAQTLLEFRIVKLLDDEHPDRTMLQQMAKAMGAESPLARALRQPGQGLDLTLGDIFKRYIVPQPLSEHAGQALMRLLQSQDSAQVLAAPRVLTGDGMEANVRIVDEHWLAGSDPSAKLEKIEYGTFLSATPHVLDADRLTLEMQAEISNPAPGTDWNQPTIARTSAETSTVAFNDRYLVWAAVTPTAAPAGRQTDRHSIYIVIKPHINLPPQGLATATAGQEPTGAPLRRVLLDVRTVTMTPGILQNLGIEWTRPIARTGVSPDSANSVSAGKNGSVTLGFLPDPTSTDLLLATLNQLQKEGQATLSSQQILSQDGRPSRLKAITEEWFVTATPATRTSGRPESEVHKTDSGTVLAITPQITGDNNITVTMALEVSERVKTATAANSNLPILTRRTVKNAITMKDGGTVVVAGLSGNGTPGTPGQETAILVTARLLPDVNQPPIQAQPTAGPNLPPQPVADLSSEQIARMRHQYVNSDAVVQALAKEIVQIERDVILLQQTMTPTHPELLRRQAHLAALKKSLEQKQEELGQRYDRELAGRTGEWAEQNAQGPRDATITVTFAQTDLRDVLAEISRRSGAKIVPDATVKPTQITAEFADVSVDSALQQILKGTDCTFKRAANGSYLVFRPLSNSWPGIDLCQVLQDLSRMAGVPIVAAPNVSGTVNAAFENLSLDEALQLVLAGKPYVFRKMPRYYLVADRTAIPPAPATPAPPTVRAFSKISAAFAQTDLRDVLAEIARRTGAQITPDATVKPTPITAELIDASVDAALQQVLKGTPYTLRRADDGTYLVFRPLSNSWPGMDLCQVLQDLAVMAGVPIVTDPNVSGTVTVSFDNVSLDEALEIVLAGRPCVLKTPNYYLVATPSAHLPTPAYAPSAVHASPQPTATFTNKDLREVLAETSKRLGVKIDADATVKPTPVTAEIAGTTPEAALRQALQSTPYTFEKKDDGTYLVFRPLTAHYARRPLREALNDLSATAGVPILDDPTISEAGGVEVELMPTVHFEDLPLEEALQKLLVGTPYCFKKMPRSFLLVRRPRQVLLEARVVSLERGALPNLGVAWSWPTPASVMASAGPVSSSWPYAIQIGYTPDQTFTDSLMTALNLLAENGLADILSNPKIVALDGRQAEMKVMQEQWYLVTVPPPPELLKVETGTVLKVMPHIDPNDNLTLQTVLEVSDSMPATRGSDQPLVTRRTTRNSITIRDGGTVAVAGLTAKGEPQKDKTGREVAVFLTARLVADTEPVVLQAAAFAETKTRDQEADNDAKAEQTSDTGQSTSRAWYIMRQWNCPPLLLGLTQQFAKVLEPSRRNDPAWREVANGGSLRLKLDVEGDLPGEVVVGLFQDARWSAEPVAVRRLRAGTHVLTGLPAGRYQIGAMLGNAPVPLALGVHRTWPEPVEIKAGQTATAEVLVAEAFQKWASGWYNEEVAKDYLGQWDDLHEDNLLQGQLTGPDGKPVPFGLIEIREHNPGARGIATADQGTNEQGLYKFDGMDWPYTITAVWRDGLPSVLGQRRQRLYLSRVLQGAQREDFRFAPFPEGTARVAGRVVDQNGKPVQGFFLRVYMPPFSDLDLARVTDGYKAQVTYDVPFISAEGRFELGGLPAGRATVDIVPFEVPRYQHERGKDIVLEAGQTAQAEVKLVGKGVFYGRVLFEDGTPAVIRPTPWRGAVTRIMMTFGIRAGGVGEVGPDGYFTLYLGDSDKEALSQGNSRLLINVPTDQENRWDSVGEFPYEKLAEDKSKAGTVTVKRPAPTPTLPPKLRSGGPLPSGWRLEYTEESRPDRRRWTQVSLSTRLATANPSAEEQLELYGPDGKRVKTFGPRSVLILDKAQPYTLLCTLPGDRLSDEWPVTRGPFLLDLSRPGRYTLMVDLSTMPDNSPKVGQDDTGEETSRAWYILRQINGAPLLLGLTQQLLKVLEPSRQDAPIWQEVAGGGSLTLDVTVEKETGREIVVGLFPDAKWSQEPVAVRRLPCEGTYTLTGLPAGRYQIGAMIGRAPSPAALGVQRTWPAAVELRPGGMTKAELLVSQDFAFHASGRYNREVSRDYTGDWSLLDQNHLLQGRLTGPGGAPIPFGQVQVREYKSVPTGSIAAPNLGTNEDGLYKCDKMQWPYRVGALWYDTLPEQLGLRYQYKNLNRVFEGPQQVDLRFDPFPSGTARIAGRVMDQDGGPVPEFFLRVQTTGFTAALRNGRLPDPDGKTYTEFGYKVPFASPDGTFELGGLPEGPVTVDAIAFDNRQYAYKARQETTLMAGRTTTVQVELTRNPVFHGRVLFEDGRPAVATPAPWEDARTTIRLHESFAQAPGHNAYTIQTMGELDAAGYFRIYLRDSELEHLRSGSAKLRIRLPEKQKDQWQSPAEFPLDKLAEDPSRAGTVTIPAPAYLSASTAGV